MLNIGPMLNIRWMLSIGHKGGIVINQMHQA